jgi:hypothetical protein
VTSKFSFFTPAQVVNAAPVALWQERQWQCADQSGEPLEPVAHRTAKAAALMLIGCLRHVMSPAKKRGSVSAYDERLCAGFDNLPTPCVRHQY